MEFSQFNFENISWLWGFIIVPIVFMLYAFVYHINSTSNKLERFIDKDLLPHLLAGNSKGQKFSIWQSIIIWSVLWLLLIIALAGPRWSFREIDTFKEDKSLVILLDLSQSMNAEDIKPSRIKRAKQEIEDILHLAEGVKIALVAFAADSHMITPLTNDTKAISHLLAPIDTSLIYVQGSKLSPALEMAEKLLDAEPGNNKSILIITDGGFQDASAISVANNLAKKNITINTMGIGSTDGAPVRDNKGNFIKQNDQIVISKIDTGRLQEISKISGGKYIEAHYSDADGKSILNQLNSRAKEVKKAKHKTKYWEERFYIFLFPLMAILLFWFRRGFVFPVIIIAITSFPNISEAKGLKDYFKNNQQLGKESLEKNDYESAVNQFDDSYRRGVAQYKAGDFAGAEESFNNSTRDEISRDSKYNLGNTLAKQNKFKEAITVYEDVLKKWPDYNNAKENLSIVNELLKEQEKKPDNQNQDDNQESNEDQENSEQENDSKSSESDNKNEKDSKSQKNNEQDQKENANEQETKKQNEDEENKQDSVDENKPEDNENMSKDDEKNNSESSENDNQQTERKPAKTQQDIDADQWLNRVTNTPEEFLKNQFYIESQRNKTKEENNPW